MKKKILMCTCLICALTTACGADKGDIDSTESVESTESSSTVISTEDYDYRDYVTLGQYTGFEVSVPTTTVSDEDVATALSDLQTSNVEYTATDATVVSANDYINASYTISDDAGDDLSAYDTNNVEIHQGAGSYFTQLEDALIGMAVGSTNSVDVNVADDYYDSTLAGKTVTYNITINSVDSEVIPEVTDDWIASVTECSTLDEWKEATKADLEETKKSEQESVFKTGVQNYIISNATFQDLPEELVNEMITSYKEEDAKMADSLGYEFNDFITTYYGYEDEDAYTADLTEYVEQSIKMDFVLRALRDAEDISMSEDDLDAFIADCTEAYGFSDSKELVNYYGDDVVKAACLNNKTWDTICAMSTMVEDENYYSEDGDYSYTEDDEAAEDTTEASEKE